MTVATNIVLADALGTPVNHTFVPMGPDSDGVFWFVDQSQANAIGFWRISVKIKQPPQSVASGQSSAVRNYRITVGLHEPVLETLSNNSSGLTPAPTVAYVPKSVTEYVISERSTLQNRKDLRKMTGNLQLNSNIEVAVENLFTLQ